MAVSWFVLVSFPAGVVLLVTGALLLFLARRGVRVDDHPTCRQCGFDLFNRNPAGRVCPECGTRLSEPRAIVTDRRTPARGAFWGGVGAGVFGLILLLNAGASAWKYVNANALKPVFMLQTDAFSSTRAKQVTASAELLRRLKAGALSDAQINSIADDVLRVQADVAVTWNPMWGTLFEQAERRGKVDAARVTRYASAAKILSITTRDQVLRGSPLPLQILFGNDRASLHDWPNEGPAMRLQNVRWAAGVNGIDLPAGSVAAFVESTLSGQAKATPQSATINLKSVEQRLSDGPLSITLVMAGQMVWNDPSRFGTGVLADVRRQFDLTTRLVSEPGEIPVDFDQRTELLDEMRRRIAPRTVRIRPGQPWAGIIIDFDDQPADIAYDVFFKAGEKEWPAGKLTKAAGQTLFQQLLSPAENFPPDIDRVDLLMRPSEKAAREANVPLRPFAVPLIYEGIRVDRTPAR